MTEDVRTQAGLPPHSHQDAPRAPAPGQQVTAPLRAGPRHTGLHLRRRGPGLSAAPASDAPQPGLATDGRLSQDTQGTRNSASHTRRDSYPQCTGSSDSPTQSRAKGSNRRFSKRAHAVSKHVAGRSASLTTRQAQLKPQRGPGPGAGGVSCLKRCPDGPRLWVRPRVRAHTNGSNQWMHQ